MNNQIPISYFQDCKKELEYTLFILNEGNEKEYYLAQFFYEDANRSQHIPINFIIPIPSSVITFYFSDLGKIIAYNPIKVSQTDLMFFVTEYISWINTVLSSYTNDYLSLEIINTFSFCNSEIDTPHTFSPTSANTERITLPIELKRRLEVLNKQIVIWYEKDVTNIKSRIASEIAQIRKDLLDSSNRQNELYLKASNFVREVFPFIEHKENNWKPNNLIDLVYHKKTVERPYKKIKMKSS